MRSVVSEDWETGPSLLQGVPQAPTAHSALLPAQTGVPARVMLQNYLTKGKLKLYYYYHIFLALELLPQLYY